MSILQHRDNELLLPLSVEDIGWGQFSLDSVLCKEEEEKQAFGSIVMGCMPGLIWGIWEIFNLWQQADTRLMVHASAWEIFVFRFSNKILALRRKVHFGHIFIVYLNRKTHTMILLPPTYICL